LLHFKPFVDADDDLDPSVGNGITHHTTGLKLLWIVHGNASPPTNACWYQLHALFEIEVSASLQYFIP
jgi:hypothetical protein